VELQGAHVVVTGGSSGIGLAAAHELLRRGARVTIMARDDARLAAAAAELGDVATVSLDVADAAAVQAAFRELDPIEGLITSAGMVEPGYFVEQDADVFEQHMAVNFFGTLHPIRAVVPGMVERRRGAIVGVSSAAGLIGVFGYTAYGASKFAVRGLLEALRAELAPHGVTVGCAFPPDTDTPMLAYEDALKPAETKAISGTIKPLSAERVGRSIVDGLERGDAYVLSDLQTKALARVAGLARGSLNRMFDRKVRKVTASNPER
jgi:3-dehydrosphinganine reductase